MWANHFQIKKGKGATQPTLHRYRIEMVPLQGAIERLPRRKKQGLIKQYLEHARVRQFGGKIATDLSQFLVSAVELEDLTKEPVDVVHRINESHDFPEAGSAQEKRNTYSIKLVHVTSHDLTQLARSVKTPDVHITNEEKAEITQELNIILAFNVKLRTLGLDPEVFALGAHRFYKMKDPFTPTFNLTGSLEAWRGYFMSVRPTSAFTVNIQIKHCAAYKAFRTVAQLIEEFRRDIFNRRPQHRREEQFLKKLRGSLNFLKTDTNKSGSRIVRIKTILEFARPKKNDKFRCPEIGAPPSRVEFYLDNSNGTAPGLASGWYTVKDYFKRRYGLQTNDAYPVLNCGTREKPTYYPMEALDVLPGQPATFQLYPQQTQKMISYSVRNAPENALSIVNEGQRVLGLRPAAENPALQAFNLALAEELTKVANARILPTPNVQYGNMAARIKDGQWNLAKTTVHKPVQLSRGWACLCITAGREGDDQWTQHTRRWLQALKQTMRNMGLKDNLKPEDPPMHSIIVNINSEESMSLIDTKINGAAQKFDFLLVISNTDDKQVFNRVKLAGDVKFGILTRFTLRDKFMKGYNFTNSGRPSDQFNANLVLKINCGLNGHNQIIRSDDVGFISKGETMLLGYDVTHPSPGSAAETPGSIVGLVATINGAAARYLGDFRIQPERQEIVSDLQDLTKGRLKKWQAANSNRLPKAILVFRDGVSEGQYAQVCNEELPQIRAACHELSGGKSDIQITLLVASKRHNTRFYPSAASDVGNKGSPPNGLVVDRTVTDPRMFDFYMQPHKPLQGTARPCHYIILHDEVFRNVKPPPGLNAADYVQKILHNLCYSFQVSTTSISQNPACFYADRLCDRVRRWLYKYYEPSDASSSGTMDIQYARTIHTHPRLQDCMFFV